MRGTQCEDLPERQGHGIIPAYAGNTSDCRGCGHRSRDHPRVCGEHRALKLDQANFKGSSPRMRGTLGGAFALLLEVGIIPAYAGNTISITEYGKQLRDHPRVCGEHLRRTRLATTLSGSSPRMRGTLDGTTVQHLVPGIIPAYAGNTDALTEREVVGRDHPRVCGEHSARVSATRWAAGSSPRMRGTLLGIEDKYGVQGIIPAYAGNTVHYGAYFAIGRDHPRVCGEHPTVPATPLPLPGSSPRMRGTLVGHGGIGDGDGIIPAYAGNTFRCSG